ncbi:hypothetical protein BH11PSE11_BH11PSE11_10330 [soil metagenome]
MHEPPCLLTHLDQPIRPWQGRRVSKARFALRIPNGPFPLLSAFVSNDRPARTRPAERLFAKNRPASNHVRVVPFSVTHGTVIITVHHSASSESRPPVFLHDFQRIPTDSAGHWRARNGDFATAGPLHLFRSFREGGENFAGLACQAGLLQSPRPWTRRFKLSNLCLSPSCTTEMADAIHSIFPPLFN